MKNHIQYALLLLASMTSCFHMKAQGNATLPTSLSHQATECYLQGEYAERAFNLYDALEWYRKGLALDPGNPLLLRKIAQCHMKRGEYEACRQALGKLPTDSLTHTDLRFKYKLYKQLQEQDSMMLVGKAIIARYPYDSEIVAGLASAFNEQSMPDSALAYTEQYIHTDSANVPVNRQRALAFYQKKDYTRASHLYTRLIQANDHYASTYYYAGMCYVHTDNLEQAYETLTKASMLNKDNPYILSQLGLVCLDLGDKKEEGITCLEETLTLLQPDKTLMYSLNYSLSDAYFSRSEYWNCLRHLKACLTLDPSSPYLLYKLARTYAALNDEQHEEHYYQAFIDSLGCASDATEALYKLADLAKSRLHELKEKAFIKNTLAQ